MLSDKFSDIKTSLTSTNRAKELQNDPDHFKYVLSQSAITEHLHQNENVGVKIGWLLESSVKNLQSNIIPDNWDELKFDRIHAEFCPNSNIQCLYAKAGLKQPIFNRHANISEAPPYTAYANDNRFIIELHKKIEINDICRIKPRTVNQWRSIVQICFELIKYEIFEKTILACEITHVSRKTVQLILSHWINRTSSS